MTNSVQWLSQLKYLGFSTQSAEIECEKDVQLLQKASANNSNQGQLRLWESPNLAIVYGYGGNIHNDVFLEKASQNTIPIIRRKTGGGTVMQGPGCLTYTFILPISLSPEFEKIPSTNKSVLAAVKYILSGYFPSIESQGDSDLCLNAIKFSGNAQKRSRTHILFHGTILYSFNLSVISDYLKEPPKQPEYRQSRPHQTFIQNLEISQKELISAFKKHCH